MFCLPVFRAVLVLGMFMLGAGVPSVSAEEDVLRVVGSTTVLPVVSRAAEKFAAANGVRITVNAGGSGVGVNSAGSGQADIGMVSREITAQEMERFHGANLTVHVVGRDAVACVVSSEVFDGGVQALSRKQIQDIYLGKVRNWKELGGPDRAIVVIDKERHRGTRHVFMKYVFGDESAPAPGARLVTGSNNEEQSKIAQSDAAIGMLSIAWINKDVRGVAILEAGASLEPTLANIVSGRFPISRNLNLVTAGEPRGQVRAFIEFLLGPEGQSIVRESGYIPIGPIALPGSQK